MNLLNIHRAVTFFLLLVIGSDVKVVINKATQQNKFRVIVHFRFMTSGVAMTNASDLFVRVVLL